MNATSTLHPEDLPRIASLLSRVRALMLDVRWRTLASIRAQCGGSECSVSARLRDLRRPEYGGFTVEHERRSNGTWFYRVDAGPQRRLF